MRLACVWGLAVVLSVALAVPAPAQQKLSPTDTVLAFYRLLRDQRYSEGFALSVYREAVDGLSEQDMAELSADFQRTFANIPEKIDVKGEQVSGDSATVFARFDSSSDAAQEVTLIREDGRWLVGDRESLEQVRAERTAFFFNTRIRVNHNEVFELIKQISGTEDVRIRDKKAYASLEEMVAEDGLGDDIKDGVANGYRFVVQLTPDRQAFTIAAVPLRYGRTGKLSFFADAKSIHAADAGGLAVNEQAPVLVDDVFKDQDGQR